jgi:hypothetical protein
MRDITYLRFELPPRFHCCQPVLAWGVAGGGTGASKLPDPDAGGAGGGLRGWESIGAGAVWSHLRGSNAGAVDPQPPGVGGKGGGFIFTPTPGGGGFG